MREKIFATVVALLVLSLLGLLGLVCVLSIFYPPPPPPAGYVVEKSYFVYVCRENIHMEEREGKGVLVSEPYCFTTAHPTSGMVSESWVLTLSNCRLDALSDSCAIWTARVRAEKFNEVQLGQYFDPSAR